MKNNKQNTDSKPVRLLQIVCGVLVLTNVAALAYIVTHPEFDPVRDDPYPLIDVARNFVPQEHYLSTLQPLRERVHALVEAEEEMKISVYIEFLNTGANISINQEERFFPASFAKVPVAMAVMGMVESDIWTLDQVLTLEEEDRAPLPSTIHQHPTGKKFTVRELLDPFDAAFCGIFSHILHG